MKHLILTIVSGIILLICTNAYAAKWTVTLSEYQCIEVEKFIVDRNDYSTKKLERAASIPDESLVSLQHKIVGEIIRKSILPEVKKADLEPCKSKAIVFGGKVTEYKKGSRAARILIGLGAGKQKFEVQSYIKDKQTGNILASKKIVDRKFGGIAGGDEAKGERDFAEKAMRFVRSGK